MKKILFLFLALMLASNANAETYSTRKSIHVEGTCFSKTAEDKISLNVRIYSEDKVQAEKAYARTKGVYNSLEKYITSLNLDGLELETGYIHTSILKEWDKEKKKSVKVGYSASASLTLDMPIKNKDKVAKIIDEVSKYNEADVSDLNTYVSAKAMDEEKTKCLGEAMKNAKEKAKYMASSVSAEVIGLLSADADVVNNYRPVYRTMMATSMAKSESFEAQPIEIHNKDQEVTVKVDTYWEIK